LASQSLPPHIFLRGKRGVDYCTWNGGDGAEAICTGLDKNLLGILGLGVLTTVDARHSLLQVGPVIDGWARDRCVGHVSGHPFAVLNVGSPKGIFSGPIHFGQPKRLNRSVWVGPRTGWAALSGWVGGEPSGPTHLLRRPRRHGRRDGEHAAPTPKFPRRLPPVSPAGRTFPAGASRARAVFPSSPFRLYIRQRAAAMSTKYPLPSPSSTLHNGSRPLQVGRARLASPGALPGGPRRGWSARSGRNSCH
jgi:hypothetical protein